MRDVSRLDGLIRELCPHGVQYRELGDVGKFYGGLTGKSKSDFTDGNAKFITYKNVYSNPALKLDVDEKVKIADGEKQHTVQYGDIIFTGSSETPDECGFSSVITQKTDEKLYLNSFCFFFRFNHLGLLIPDFAKHLFRSSNLRYQIGKTASGVTRFNVSKKLMEKVVIPIPPLPIQREIVCILDNFTELTEQLTMELIARKKQYEYYRTRLLEQSKNVSPMITVSDLGKWSGSKTPSMTKYEAFDFQKVLNYKIPLPPLDTQIRLAQVLDNFESICSDLNINLPAEIEARKKQYECYRAALLMYASTGSIIAQTDGYNSLIRLCQYVFGSVSIELGSIGRISMCKRIMKSETNTQSGVPFFKIGTFGKEPDAYISKEKFCEYKEKYPYPKKGDVLISAAGTIGRTVVFDGEPAYYQDSNIVWVANDETIVLNSYLYYCYQLQPWAISTGGTIARLYNDNISKAKITVPSIEEQKRIVEILDRFNSLCTDMSNGLPAEIAARQKQYEYYRDKLLTFQELS